MRQLRHDRRVLALQEGYCSLEMDIVELGIDKNLQVLRELVGGRLSRLAVGAVHGNHQLGVLRDERVLVVVAADLCEFQLSL